MLHSKRGASSSWTNILMAFGIIIGILIVAFGFSWAAENLFGASAEKPDLKTELANAKTVSDVLGDYRLKPLTYIVGGVPESLIAYVGSPGAAVLIIFALFILILVSFSDILAQFSLFSKPAAWVIGSVLAIVAANLKLIMMIAIWSFGIAAGLGVVSTAIGILVPFLVFGALNFKLFPAIKQMKAENQAMKIATDATVGAAAIEAGASTMAAVGTTAAAEGAAAGRNIKKKK